MVHCVWRGKEGVGSLCGGDGGDCGGKGVRRVKEDSASGGGGSRRARAGQLAS